MGSRLDGDRERPRAVSEYLVERMILGGARKICFVIAPGKSDILHYYGGCVAGTPLYYAIQTRPAGLCDAIFQVLPLVGPDEHVLVRLPDTVWFPEDALCRLDDGPLSFLLFPVQHPELFDAVVTDDLERVLHIDVKQPEVSSHWVWGAFKVKGAVLHDLHGLWRERPRPDEYVGTLVNEYLARGGEAKGVRGGEAYVDVGTLNGYREAVQLLAARDGAHPLGPS